MVSVRCSPWQKSPKRLSMPFQFPATLPLSYPVHLFQSETNSLVKINPTVRYDYHRKLGSLQMVRIEFHSLGVVEILAANQHKILIG